MSQNTSPSSPLQAQPQRSHHPALFQRVILSAVALTLLYGLLSLFAGSPPIVLIVVALMLLTEGIAYAIFYFGKEGLASVIFIFGGWALTLFPAFYQGGLESPFILISFLMIVAAGLLLDIRYTVVLIAINCVVITLLYLSGEYRWLPQLIPAATGMRRWAVVITVGIGLGVLHMLSIAKMNSALAEARQKALALEESNQLLQAAQAEMEQHVVQRTGELEAYAHRLQTALQAMSVAPLMATRDMQSWFDPIAPLIAKEFTFDHLALFLLDESGDQLTLQAIHAPGQGSGRYDGVEALAGLTLPINATRIIETALRSRQPSLASGLEQFSAATTSYRPLPIFPAAAAELALPLVGEQAPGEAEPPLLGLLHLQSAQASDLTREDVQILQALADQMAAAIQNRQIFEHSQQSLANLQQAHAAISQEAWQNLLRARPGQGLRLTAGGHPAQAVGPWLPDMIQAQRSAQLVQEDAFTLALPLKIRQQVAGVLRLSKPRDGRPWSHAEIDLLQTLADRLSAALETARLFEETQRRAERERLTGEITARIRASNDQQAILEIAARELRRALNADRAQLAIQAVRVQPSTSGSEATAPIKEVP